MPTFTQNTFRLELRKSEFHVTQNFQNTSKPVIIFFHYNRPNALSAQAPRSGAKERLIVTKHNLDLMNVTNYS